MVNDYPSRFPPTKAFSLLIPGSYEDWKRLVKTRRIRHQIFTQVKLLIATYSRPPIRRTHTLLMKMDINSHRTCHAAWYTSQSIPEPGDLGVISRTNACARYQRTLFLFRVTIQLLRVLRHEHAGGDATHTCFYIELIHKSTNSVLASGFTPRALELLRTLPLLFCWRPTIYGNFICIEMWPCT